LMRIRIHKLPLGVSKTSRDRSNLCSHFKGGRLVP
jgi:hypothetical protein